MPESRPPDGVPTPAAKPRLRPPRRLLLAAILLSGLVIGSLTASWWVAGRLTAPRSHGDIALPGGLDVEPFTMTDARGRGSAGWDVIPATAAGPRGVVVLLHGLYGDRRAMVGRARFLAAAGYASVLVDLHAHGEADGDRITLGHEERYTAEAAVAHARKRFPSLPVAVIGVSLGGAATALAAPLGVDAVVLESVFPDIESAIRHRVRARLGPLAAWPSWLLLAQVGPRLGVRRDQLRPVDRLGSLHCPLFIAAGAEDPHTPPAETRRLFAAAPGPKQLWLVEGAAHVDLHGAATAEYETRLLAFLDDALALPALIHRLYAAFCFDADGEADWDALRSDMAAGATFVSPVPEGQTPTGVDTERFLADFQAFIRQSPLGESGYHERVVRTRIDHLGAVAHAWVTFEAFVPGQGVDRRGVDSLQLVRDGAEWKLVSFTTQYESDALALPPRFAPASRVR